MGIPPNDGPTFLGIDIRTVILLGTLLAGFVASWAVSSAAISRLEIQHDRLEGRADALEQAVVKNATRIDALSDALNDLRRVSPPPFPR